MYNLKEIKKHMVDTKTELNYDRYIEDEDVDNQPSFDFRSLWEALRGLDDHPHISKLSTEIESIRGSLKSKSKTELAHFIKLPL